MEILITNANNESFKSEQASATEISSSSSSSSSTSSFSFSNHFTHTTTLNATPPSRPDIKIKIKGLSGDAHASLPTLTGQSKKLKSDKNSKASKSTAKATPSESDAVKAELFCICRKSSDEDDDDDMMIECDVCKDWLHGK